MSVTRLLEIKEEMEKIAYSQAKCDNYDIAQMLLFLMDYIDVINSNKQDIEKGKK